MSLYEDFARGQPGDRRSLASTLWPQPSYLIADIPPRLARNFLIFPVQMDASNNQTNIPLFSSYSTIDMKDRLMKNPELIDHVQTVWIEVATYYKEKQGLQREFIVFSVRDTNHPQLRNFIALDRKMRFAKKGLLELLLRMRRSSHDLTLAEDQFHVSHRGDLPPLLKHCAGGVASCTVVDSLHLTQGSLGLDQLVVLASTVTRFRPHYTANQSHSYWFSNSIWDCVIEITSKTPEGGSSSRSQRSFQRARFRAIPLLAPGYRSQIEYILRDYERKRESFMLALTRNQMVSGQRYDEQRRMQILGIKARVDELQEQLEALKQQLNLDSRGHCSECSNQHTSS